MWGGSLLYAADSTDTQVTEWPSSMVSNTLPVLYINTENGAEIVSKENYINATYWIDPKDTGYDAFGSEEEPLETEIRGRGNWTWSAYEKKPYKLKLGEKTALFGLPKNKHWALLAEANSLTFVTTHLGMEISKLMGLDWTPAVVPVEVVLNDEYIGFYNLVETIRVDKNRVNIAEQKDEETDPDEIRGAWLLEIDNNPAKYQVSLTEGNGNTINITPDTPEVLSDEQYQYLKEQMQLLNELIHAQDKSDSTELEKILDFKALAKYYLVQEVIDDQEGFSGSCFFYKDKGENQKWIFGPIWDMGNAFRRANRENHFFDGEFTNHWIEELLEFPKLQDEIKAEWLNFVENNSIDDLVRILDEYANLIKEAYSGPNNLRWSNTEITHYYDFNWGYDKVRSNLITNFNIVNQWYNENGSVYEIDMDKEPLMISYHDLFGRKIDNPSIKGVIIKVTVFKDGSTIKEKIIQQ